MMDYVKALDARLRLSTYSWLGRASKTRFRHNRNVYEGQDCLGEGSRSVMNSVS